MTIPNNFYEDLGFIGIDSHHAPHRLGPGYLQQADNVYVNGGDPVIGGNLVTRPGIRGELAAARGAANPVYDLQAFLKSDGSTAMIYTSGGRLYYKAKGETADHEIQTAKTITNATNATPIVITSPTHGLTTGDSAAIVNVVGNTAANGTWIVTVIDVNTFRLNGSAGNGAYVSGGTFGAAMGLNSATTFSARSGNYQYYVDGQAASALKRTDLTTGAAVSALTQPSSAGFNAGLDNDSLASLTAPGTLAWTQDGFNSPDTNLISDPDFTDTTTGAIGAHAWQRDPGSSLFSVAGGTGRQGTNAVWIDDANEQIISKLIAVPPHVTATTVHARLFEVQWTVYNGNNNPDVSAHDMIFTAYDVSNSVIAGGTFTYHAPLSSYGNVFKQFVDFSFLPADIVSVKIQFIVPNGQQFFGVSMNHISIKCPQQLYTLQAAGDGASLVVKPGTFEYNGGTLYTAGSTFEVDFGSGQDWSSYSRLFFPLAVDSNITGKLRVQCYLRINGGSNVYTDILDISLSDGTAFVDISTIDAVLVRKSVRFFGFRILDNFNIADNTKSLFTIGPVKIPGNLSIGAGDYSYLIVEVDDTADPANLFDIVQSNGSVNCGSIRPLKRTAVGLVTMPARTNSLSPTCNYFKIFRFGGTFSDGFGRLVALERFDTSVTPATPPYPGNDTAKGTAPYYAAPANPYITWTKPAVTGAAGGIFRDNTPDSFLVNAEIYKVGREAAPAEANTICEWNNRIVLAKGSDLYLSWLTTSEASAGLYFTRVNVSSDLDPNAAIKGFFATVGGKDNDTIQRVVPYGSRLIIFKQRSRWILTGDNPDNFVLRPFRLTDGLGCIAPRACLLHNGAVWYLSQDGLRTFDGINDNPGSLLLEKLLNPSQAGGTAIPAAAYAGCALFAHARRLKLAAPVAGAGGGANSVVYVLDSRQGGWTRYTGVAVTGGADLGAAADTENLFLAGLDGQVYAMSYDGAAYGDRANSQIGTPITPVTMVVKTRAHGQQASGLAQWGQNKPVSVRLDVNAAEAAALTTTVTGANAASAWSNTYAVAAGDKSWWQRVSPSAKGNNVSITVNATVTQPLTLRAVALQSAEGGNR